VLVPTARTRSFPLGVLPCAREDCDRGRRRAVGSGRRWVRGYKTGLARVWRIVFVGHLRRQGFIEVKKVARHRPPTAMKWAPFLSTLSTLSALLCSPASRCRVIFANVPARRFSFFPHMARRLKRFSRDDELLSPGLLSYSLFRVRDPRNFFNRTSTPIKLFMSLDRHQRRARFCSPF
jgi:hypothetical protein